MKQCRICMQLDVTGTFQSIFCDNNGLFLPKLLYELFGTIIVDHKAEPAVICRKCENSILKAHQLKDLCRKSDEFYKIQTRNYEHYEWNDNLNSLRKQQFPSLELEELIDPIEKVEHDHAVEEDMTNKLSTSDNEEDYEEVFEFFDQIGREENAILLETLTNIPTEKSEENHFTLESEPTDCEKYESLMTVLHSIEIPPTELKNLTDQIVAVLPAPTQNLKLRINLRKLSVIRNQEVAGKQQQNTLMKKNVKLKKNKKKSEKKSIGKELVNMLKLRPRRNSII